VTTDAEDLVARLARMKALMKKLERVTADSIKQHKALARLRRLLDAARRALKPL